MNYDLSQISLVKKASKVFSKLIAKKRCHLKFILRDEILIYHKDLTIKKIK